MTDISVFMLWYLGCGALIGVHAWRDQRHEPDPSHPFVMVAVGALMGVACLVVVTFERLVNRR